MHSPVLCSSAVETSQLTQLMVNSSVGEGVCSGCATEKWGESMGRLKYSNVQ